MHVYFDKSMGSDLNYHIFCDILFILSQVVHKTQLIYIIKINVQTNKNKNMDKFQESYLQLEILIPMLSIVTAVSNCYWW